MRAAALLMMASAPMLWTCAGPRPSTHPRASADGAPLKITELRTERRVDPIGLDVAAPHLSWVLESTDPAATDQSQSAYRILVARSRENLRRGDGDLWDTGWVESTASIEVPYEGLPLESRQIAHWTVRVRDEEGRSSDWSEPATWEMGLLSPRDWSAEWIGRRPTPGPEITVEPEALTWLWYPLAPGELAETKPKSTHWVHFRKRFEIDDPAALGGAYGIVGSPHEYHLYVNGEHVFGGRARTTLQVIDLRPHLVDGTNLVAIEARPVKDAGMTFQLRLEGAGGTARTLATGTDWKTARDQADGWFSMDFDDRRWARARPVAAFGEPPFEAHRADALTYVRAEPPAYLFHRRCAPTSPGVEVTRARLYATGLGVYDLFVGGARVGDAVLEPGWTDYRQRVEVRTHDVTAVVADTARSGCLDLAATLADGWYAGWVGFYKQRHVYGGYPLRLRAQLEVHRSDGSVERIGTDGRWKAGTGPLLAADLLDGETYDARREIPGWPRPAPDTPGFEPADVMSESERPGARLVAAAGPPIRVVEERTPQRVTEPRPGTFVFDVGQNLVGWARLDVRGPAGQSVRLRFGEMLGPDGMLYTKNLRTAAATDTYVLRGDPDGERWSPRFTTHGFRYVEVTGYPGTPPVDALRVQVVQSDTPVTGHLETSSDLLDQLQHNIQWSQRGNFVGLPTDCPQRDERLGWMGDAQIFARTACFNMDVANALGKWLDDVYDAQAPDGALPDTVPYIEGQGQRPGAPAWADAGIIVPWEMYRCSGDLRFLSKHYEGMKRHIDGVAALNPDHVWTRGTGWNYGDWLSIDADTPKDVLGTAYFAHSTGLLSQIARRLGHDDDVERYDALRERIVAAFNQRFVDDDGRVAGNTQTAYLLALRFGLLAEPRRSRAAEHLVEAIERADHHLSTGFLGVRELLPVLTDIGRLDLAYRLVLNETYPSWGYSIAHGATTIWERWNGWTTAGGFGDDEMNSFNHYSLGSVGQWMYAVVGGIEADPEHPGYGHVVLHPRPGGALTHASARLRSPYGLIRSDWRIEGERFEYDVRVPVNSRATVVLPDGERHEIGSGQHHFSSEWTAPSAPPSPSSAPGIR